MLLVTTLLNAFNYDILGPFDMIVAEYKSRSVLYACLMQSGVTLSGTKQQKYSWFYFVLFLRYTATQLPLS